MGGDMIEALCLSNGTWIRVGDSLVCKKVDCINTFNADGWFYIESNGKTIAKYNAQYVMSIHFKD
jgi:hypothetical protein